MGVLLMDELSSSLCGRLFAIIVRATGAQSAHGLFLRPGMFPEDRCQGTYLEPLMAWHNVRGTHGIAPRQKRLNLVLPRGAAPANEVFQICRT